MTRSKAAALLLGFLGVGLIALGGAGAGAGGPAILIPLLAASGTAGENLIVKRLDLREAVLGVLAWQLLLEQRPGRLGPLGHEGAKVGAMAAAVLEKRDDAAPVRG